MRGYKQYCPIARGAEIFATRWTPIIVRNLLLGCRTFGEIQAGAPGIPRTLLSQRLAQLERVGIIERRPNPRRRGWLYEPTEAGEELREVVFALGTWGARWLEVAPEDLDPYVVLWSMCRAMDEERLPERRVVVRFNLRDLPKKPFWLLVQPPEAEVCVKPPGFPEDLVVTTDSESLAKWHMGRISLGDALHWGVMAIEGPRDLVRAFARWGGLSAFAHVRPARAAVPEPAADEKKGPLVTGLTK